MPFFKQNDVFAGRYRLAELLGEGSFAEVWTAKDLLVDDAMVVLKMYAPGKGPDDRGIQQYRQEFSLSQSLSHPHLLQISHFDVTDGIAFLLLPFYAAGTLDRLLGEATFSEKQVALMMSQLGSALAALHSQDPPVLHRNVIPDNIVIAGPDHYLLANFGISSQPTQPLPKAEAGSEPVTTAYTPPESFDRFLKTTSSGDVFSLGVTLFALCSKTIPLNGGGGQSLLKERYIGQLPEPYSPELNELLHACMSLNNFKRPTAEELHLRGKHFLETGNWNPPVKENDEVSPSKRAKPYLMAAVIAILLIAAASVVWLQITSAVPEEMQQPIGASVSQEIHQENDQQLILKLKNEVEELKKRTLELEEENRELLYKDSVSTVLMSGRNPPEEPEVKSAKEAKAGTIKNEKEKKVVLTPAPVAKTGGKDHAAFLQKELEQQLNKISDPALSEKERNTWKQETLAQFSENAVRILDETAGTPRQFSAGIFLNLLFNVPHTIEIKQIKRDQDKKITELRLNMQTKL